MSEKPLITAEAPNISRNIYGEKDISPISRVSIISSPMVDLGSFVLLNVVLGLVIAVIGSTLIEKLHLENQVEEYIRNGRSLDVPQEELHFKDRIKYAWEQVVSTAKRLLSMCL